MECGDFLEFQDILKKMRDVDDKIVYALNASVPSPSFRSQINPTQTCEELYNKLQENHDKREKSIRNCIITTAEKIRVLKEKKASGDDLSVVKLLNQEQTKLRLLKSELNVEEVVRDRSLKIYYERCRGFYKPKNLSIK
uniref:Protein MIX23 n=1 Tax=Panstrongylus megistus TaxID=65343 RepID=A0A069DP71_9HEMI